MGLTKPIRKQELPEDIGDIYTKKKDALLEIITTLRVQAARKEFADGQQEWLQLLLKFVDRIDDTMAAGDEAEKQHIDDALNSAGAGQETWMAFPVRGMCAGDWKAQTFASQATVSMLQRHFVDSPPEDMGNLYVKVPKKVSSLMKPNSRIFSTFSNKDMKLYLEGIITASIAKPNINKGYIVAHIPVAKDLTDQDAKEEDTTTSFYLSVTPSDRMLDPLSGECVPGWLCRVLKAGSEEKPTMITHTESITIAVPGSGSIEIQRKYLMPDPEIEHTEEKVELTRRPFDEDSKAKPPKLLRQMGPARWKKPRGTLLKVFGKHLLN